MRKYLRLIRPHHYIKNFLVFAALACSGQFFDPEKLLSGVSGFVSFCFISSVVYIVNDIRDCEKDQLHPTKCKRPIASGSISVRNAAFTAILFFAGAMICNLMVFRISSTALLLLYFVLNLAYSFGLKNVPLVDVTILVSGFLIRVVYGAMITDIRVSNWLYLTVIAVAFYFSLGKRRNELLHHGADDTRQVLKSYSVNFLDKNMYMCLTLTNVFYALWTMDKNTAALYQNDYLLFTVPIVLLITMRYSMVIEGNSDGDPVEVLIHDKVLVILCIFYLVLMACILYCF